MSSSSFYINLSSKDSLDVHPQNYGGDFQVELAAPLYFDESDPWEVALVEMTYDAQGFPNIPQEYSQIQLTALNRSEVYDTTNMDLNIRAHFKVKKDIWYDADGAIIKPADRLKTCFTQKVLNLRRLQRCCECIR
jgi:hypothetical protein